MAITGASSILVRITKECDQNFSLRSARWLHCAHVHKVDTHVTHHSCEGVLESRIPATSDGRRTDVQVESNAAFRQLG